MLIWPQKMEQLLNIATCNYELLFTTKVTQRSKLKTLGRLETKELTHYTPCLKLSVGCGLDLPPPKLAKFGVGAIL